MPYTVIAYRHRYVGATDSGHYFICAECSTEDTRGIPICDHVRATDNTADRAHCVVCKHSIKCTIGEIGACNACLTPTDQPTNNTHSTR